jgi:hypothetical protein
MGLLLNAAPPQPKTIKRKMKHFLGLVIMALVFTACNNGGEGESVGDSLTVDPTTAQPITTEPDTLGLNKDSLSVHQNQ